MIDVRFLSTDPSEIRRKLDAARELDPSVRLLMSPPISQSAIELANGETFWGDLEVTKVGRQFLTVRDASEGFEGRVNPMSGLYRYRLAAGTR